MIPRFVLRDTETFTARKWKSLKRQELKRAMKELEDFNSGCYYIPKEAFREYCEAREKLKKVQELLSVKNWGN